MILSINDFVGKYQLHTGMYDQAKLQDYIDRYEPRYLKQLLGVSLYNDFIADLLTNYPQSPNFQVIFNPLSEDMGYNFYYFNGIYEGVNQIDSEGIKDMLKGFIYYEYAKDLVNVMTPFGNVKQANENSEMANTLFSMIYTRYNEAIRSYNSIRNYITYVSNPSLGQIVTLQIINPGGFYFSDVNLNIIGGTGSNATCDITDDGSGGIDTITIVNNGFNYSIGDIVSIEQGINTSCTCEVTYVGIGDYRKFRGVPKLTAYWL